MIKKVLFAAAASTIMAGSAQAAIVNIDSTTSTGVTMQLAAGTYRVNVIGVADGGSYNAYSKHDSSGGVGPVTPAVAGCDGSGANCQFGFEDSFRTTISGLTTAYAMSGSTGRYSTALGALSAARTGISATFTLLTSTAVTFNTTDDGPFTDNTGGLSLNVGAVPEPATWGMMIVGFGMVGGVSRARRRSTKVAYA